MDSVGRQKILSMNGKKFENGLIVIGNSKDCKIAEPLGNNCTAIFCRASLLEYFVDIQH